MNDTIHISVSGLKKTFPQSGVHTSVLEVETLHVNRGEFFCILGPSGCGKSTLLNIMAGFERPTDGEVQFEGSVVRTSPPTPWRPECVVVFQEYGLFPWRTVLENISFGLEVQGLPLKKRDSQTQFYLDLVGLQGFEHSYPAQLSGGMKQRVALARALAVEPSVLFMDEPFAALDALTRLKMQEELSQIWLKTGKTIVFVTHSVDEAVFLGDRIAVMSERPGRINCTVAVEMPRPRHKLDERLSQIKRELYRNLGLED